MGDRLATINMGRKVGGCCAPFFLGGDRRSKAEATAEHKHLREWPVIASLIITLEGSLRDEYSSV